MSISDYYPQGRRMWFRLREKGGKHHELPAHQRRSLRRCVSRRRWKRAPHDTCSIANKHTPLFRTISRSGQLTSHRMHRTDVLRMIKRRAVFAGLPLHIICHTFRATGITCYLLGGRSLEHAQRLACHESARTTKLYARTADTISLDEIERIIV